MNERYLPWLVEFDRASDRVEEAQSWEAAALEQTDLATAEAMQREANDLWLSAALLVVL